MPRRGSANGQVLPVCGLNVNDVVGTAENGTLHHHHQPHHHHLLLLRKPVTLILFSSTLPQRALLCANEPLSGEALWERNVITGKKEPTSVIEGGGEFHLPDVRFEMSLKRWGGTDQGVKYELEEALCYLCNLVSFFLLPR